MANVNVRNLPDEVHRAIRIQAAHHGRSTEAEIRDILERAAKPGVEQAVVSPAAISVSEKVFH